MPAPTKALFSDDAATPAEPKSYALDYEHGGPTLMHKDAAPIPMRVGGRVYRTADAFFVVEMRAIRGKFDQNLHALERARALEVAAP